MKRALCMGDNASMRNAIRRWRNAIAMAYRFATSDFIARVEREMARVAELAN